MNSNHTIIERPGEEDVITTTDLYYDEVDLDENLYTGEGRLTNGRITINENTDIIETNEEYPHQIKTDACRFSESEITVYDDEESLPRLSSINKTVVNIRKDLH